MKPRKKGVFLLTGTVITPGNYKKYRKGEITGEVKYEPADFRPPEQWYKEMGLNFVYTKSVDLNHYGPKKPGPKSGSGSRTAVINCRCRPETLQLLKYLQKSGWNTAGKSVADLIEQAVYEMVLLNTVDSSEEVDRWHQAIKPR